LALAKAFVRLLRVLAVCPASQALTIAAKQQALGLQVQVQTQK
jgi:hypothetical protein